MDSYVQQKRVVTRVLKVPAMLAALLVVVVGCGQQDVVEAVSVKPPEQFSERGQVWQLQTGGPTKADNSQLGSFFKKNESLIGSPDWTGEPLKYVNGSSKSLERFYWFNGTEQKATWNAVEFQGSRFRQLSGVGLPGEASPGG